MRSWLFVFSLCAGSAVVAPSVEGTAIADKLTERRLASVDRNIEKASKAMDSARVGEVELSARQRGNIESLVFRLERDIKKLDANDPAVQQRQKRIASLRERFEKGQAAVASAAKEAEGNRAVLKSEAKALVGTDEWNKDLEELKRLSRYFYEKAHWYSPSADVFILGIKRYKLEPTIAEIPTVHANLAAYDALRAEYARFLDGGASSDLGPLGREFGEATRTASTLRETLGSFVEKVPGLIDERVKLLKSDADKYLKSKDIRGFWGGPSKMATELETWPVVYEALGGSNAAALRSRAQQGVAEYQRVLTELEAEIVAQNSPPANDYKGSDRKKLESMLRTYWKQHFPGDKLVQVRIVGDWTREKNSRWIEASKSWQHQDYSWLRGYAIVKLNAKTAAFVYAAFEKDHRKGDKLSISAKERSQRWPPNATRKVLLKKLR